MIAIQKFLGAVSLVLGVMCASVVWAQDAEKNAIEAVTASQVAGNILLKLQLKSPLEAPPAGFSVATPPRVVFDFPNTMSSLEKNNQSFNLGDLKGINLVQVGDKTRLVLNLVRNLNYDVKVDEGALLITLFPIMDSAVSSDKGSATHFTREALFEARHGIKDIIFRRGKDGEGRIVVDLTDPGTGIDIQQRGKDLIVEFLKTDLPANLRRKLDVTDFGTPVVSVVTEESGRNVRMTITPKGKWEHNAYQADNQFVVEVRPIIEDPNKLVQGSKIGYQGPRISINYQNGDVRALLRLMAEELGLNVVISESVTGTTTLVLKDVPADQVIDIIFQQKGLDMRKKDNVMIIAPRDELAAREKLEFESRQQLEELEPLRTETFQLNYHDAEAFKKILTDKEQRILSKRGSAIIDPRSNILFIQDTPTRLEELRRVIATVDIPVRQVMIEARIVEANDQFARNLGARLGFFKRDSSNLWAGGGNSEPFVDFLNTGTKTLPDLNQVNFPAGTYKNVDPSQFSFLLFNSAGTRFLNLELSALEADLKGKIVSSPRVMTSDQVEAMIEQGVEIPYQNATSSGATSVEFKKATLSLRVKPHITPDGKISMRLAINKDSVGDVVPGGVSINTKKVETEVLVDNGGTIVIGGIYEMVNRNDENKVPFLGDVPLLGYAFKTTSRVNEKTELLVFITPRVVNNQLNLQ